MSNIVIFNVFYRFPVKCGIRMGRRATETYCRDETDPIKHSRGLDFVTECWFCVIYPMGPMGPWAAWAAWAPWARRAGGRPRSPWGSCRFAGIHFQESDLSFEQNLNCFASVKAPDLVCFP